MIFWDDRDASERVTVSRNQNANRIRPISRKGVNGAKEENKSKSDQKPGK